MNDLPSAPAPVYVTPATPRIGRKGPVPKRRYQEGVFKPENGHYYSFFYRGRLLPDGSSKSVFTRIDLGKVGKISELSARREHDRLRQQINRERGSVPTAPKGETYEEVAATYIRDIGPQLSISTVRQRTSHLHAHLLPSSSPLRVNGAYGHRHPDFAAVRY